MGVLIFSGAYFGKYLDGIYPSSKKWFTMLFTILSIAISLYLLVKQVNRINKKEDEN
jgi:F0F1-type ATP synthase assembly protein I